MEQGTPNATTVEYVPAVHSVQGPMFPPETIGGADPALLNCPAGHGMTVALLDAAGQRYPAWHRPVQLFDVAPLSP